MASGYLANEALSALIPSGSELLISSTRNPEGLMLEWGKESRDESDTRILRDLPVSLMLKRQLIGYLESLAGSHNTLLFRPLRWFLV